MPRNENQGLGAPKISEIKKGDKFVCINDPNPMVLDHNQAYVGREYEAKKDGRLDLEGHWYISSDKSGLEALNKDFARALPSYKVTTYDSELSEAADKFLEHVHASEDDSALIGYNIPRAGRVNIPNEHHNNVTSFEENGQPSNISDFQKITNALADLLAYKNMKYGNSALNPLNVFTGKSKVGQRLDDKLSRIQNSTELRKNDVADVIGYLILVCKENNWTTFDEFKD